MSNQIPGILIIVGSLFFFIAASMVSSIYREPDIEIILNTIDENKSEFILSQLFFALGGLLPAIGFSIFLVQLKNHENVSAIEIWSTVVSLILGSILWGIHVVMRTINTREYFLTSDTRLRPITSHVVIPLLYILLTIIGFAILSLIFYKISYPIWISIMLFVISILSLILIILIGGAFPPVFYYIFTIIIGIRMLNLSVN